MWSRDRKRRNKEDDERPAEDGISSNGRKERKSSRRDSVSTKSRHSREATTSQRGIPDEHAATYRSRSWSGSKTLDADEIDATSADRKADKKEKRRKSSSSDIGKRRSNSDARADPSSSQLQDQFPGQFSAQSSSPYRPPPSTTEGGFGFAAEYYGDMGESVAFQPGVRTHSPSLIIGTEPHLQPASSVHNPPPEPSAVGATGAAASFYSGTFDDAATKPSSQPTSTTYSSVLDQPTLSHHSGSSSINPALAIASVGAAGAYMANSRPSNQQPLDSESTSQHVSHPLPHGSSQPSKTSSHHSNASPYVTGAAAAAHANSHPNHTYDETFGGNHAPLPNRHRRRHSGPLGAVVDFIQDPDGVADFEEYTEYIGVCKGCFEPGSSARDAPRPHRHTKRRSKERRGSSSRIDKQHRYSSSSSASSDDEKRRQKGRSWLATGIAGYSLAKVGQTLFSQRNDFGDTYEVKSGRQSPGSNARPSTYGTSSSKNDGKRASKTSSKIAASTGSSVFAQSSERSEKPRIESTDSQGVFSASADVGTSSMNNRHRTYPSKPVSIHNTASQDASPRRRKKHKSHRENLETKKKRKGFFNLLSSSSSTSSLDSTAGRSTERQRKRRTSPGKIRNHHEAEAALVGLGAATAALSLHESHEKSRTRRDRLAQKDPRFIYRTDEIRPTPGSNSNSDEGWISASDGDGECIDSDLAFGSPSRRLSQVSLSSSSSGTDKWSWRWGGKTKRDRSPKANMPRRSYTEGAQTSSEPLNSHERPDAPLQYVYPIPTSDPGHFDVQHEGPFVASQPVIVSRPQFQKLEQPQPVTPVSSRLYRSQPSGVASHAQSNQSDHNGQTGVAAQDAVPQVLETAPRRDLESDLSENAELRRRQTSPARIGDSRGLISQSSSRRASTKDDLSTVRFAVSEDQEQHERRERRRKRREEKDAMERESSQSQSLRESLPSDNRPRDPQRRSDGDSQEAWTAAAAGSGGVATGAAIADSGAKKVVSHSERRERRRRERQREEKDAVVVDVEGRSSNNDQRILLQDDSDVPQPQPHEKSVWQEAAASAHAQHEDYQAFFAPANILYNHAREVSPAIVEIAPKIQAGDRIREPEWSLADQRNPPIDSLTPKHPRGVPILQLVTPTPPASRVATPSNEPERSKDRQQEDEGEKKASPDSQNRSWPAENAHVSHREEPHGSIEGPEVVNDDVTSTQESAVAPDQGAVRKSSDSEAETDYEFAAALAASAQSAGFDPSIVVDDPTYHKRESPPAQVRERERVINDDGQTSKRRKKDKKKRNKHSDYEYAGQDTPDVFDTPENENEEGKAANSINAKRSSKLYQVNGSSALLVTKDSRQQRNMEAGDKYTKQKPSEDSERLLDQSINRLQDPAQQSSHKQDPDALNRDVVPQDVLEDVPADVEIASQNSKRRRKSSSRKSYDDFEPRDPGMDTQDPRPEAKDSQESTVLTHDVLTGVKSVESAPRMMPQHSEGPDQEVETSEDHPDPGSTPFLGDRPDPPPPPDKELGDSTDVEKITISNGQARKRSNQRRPSEILFGDTQLALRGAPSPTAVPVHFKRPQTGRGLQRSTSEAPISPPHSPIELRPKARPRPRSTEFKASKEIRPLWLVERHQSRHELPSSEIYPPLPESHSTSAASSVHDAQEAAQDWSYEHDDLWPNATPVDQVERFDRAFVAASIPASEEVTPTNASFASRIQDAPPGQEAHFTQDRSLASSGCELVTDEPKIDCSEDNDAIEREISPVASDKSQNRHSLYDTPRALPISAQMTRDEIIESMIFAADNPDPKLLEDAKQTVPEDEDPPPDRKTLDPPSKSQHAEASTNTPDIIVQNFVKPEGDLTESLRAIAQGHGTSELADVSVALTQDDKTERDHRLVHDGDQPEASPKPDVGDAKMLEVSNAPTTWTLPSPRAETGITDDGQGQSAADRDLPEKGEQDKKGKIAKKSTKMKHNDGALATASGTSSGTVTPVVLLDQVKDTGREEAIIEKASSPVHAPDVEADSSSQADGNFHVDTEAESKDHLPHLIAGVDVAGSATGIRVRHEGESTSRKEIAAADATPAMSFIEIAAQPLGVDEEPRTQLDPNDSPRGTRVTDEASAEFLDEAAVDDNPMVATKTDKSHGMEKDPLTPILTQKGKKKKDKKSRSVNFDLPFEQVEEVSTRTASTDPKVFDATALHVQAEDPSQAATEAEPDVIDDSLMFSKKNGRKSKKGIDHDAQDPAIAAQEETLKACAEAPTMAIENFKQQPSTSSKKGKKNKKKIKTAIFDLGTDQETFDQSHGDSGGVVDRERQSEGNDNGSQDEKSKDLVDYWPDQDVLDKGVSSSREEVGTIGVSPKTDRAAIGEDPAAEATATSIDADYKILSGAKSDKDAENAGLDLSAQSGQTDQIFGKEIEGSGRLRSSQDSSTKEGVDDSTTEATNAFDDGLVETTKQKKREKKRSKMQNVLLDEADDNPQDKVKAQASRYVDTAIERDIGEPFEQSSAPANSMVPSSAADQNASEGNNSFKAPKGKKEQKKAKKQKVVYDWDDQASAEPPKTERSGEPPEDPSSIADILSNNAQKAQQDDRGPPEDTESFATPKKKKDKKGKKQRVTFDWEDQKPEEGPAKKGSTPSEPSAPDAKNDNPVIPVDDLSLGGLLSLEAATEPEPISSFIGPKSKKDKKKAKKSQHHQRRVDEDGPAAAPAVTEALESVAPTVITNEATDHAIELTQAPDGSANGSLPGELLLAENNEGSEGPKKIVSFTMGGDEIRSTDAADEKILDSSAAGGKDIVSEGKAVHSDSDVRDLVKSEDTKPISELLRKKPGAVGNTLPVLSSSSTSQIAEYTAPSPVEGRRALETGHLEQVDLNSKQTPQLASVPAETLPPNQVEENRDAIWPERAMTNNVAGIGKSRDSLADQESFSEKAEILFVPRRNDNEQKPRAHHDHTELGSLVIQEPSSEANVRQAPPLTSILDDARGQVDAAETSDEVKAMDLAATTKPDVERERNPAYEVPETTKVPVASKEHFSLGEGVSEPPYSTIQQAHGSDEGTESIVAGSGKRHTNGSVANHDLDEVLQPARSKSFPPVLGLDTAGKETPFDTPVSATSTDLLDAEGQRKYNEAYQRELQKQLGTADEDVTARSTQQSPQIMTDAFAGDDAQDLERPPEENFAEIGDDGYLRREHGYLHKVPRASPHVLMNSDDKNKDGRRHLSPSSDIVAPAKIESTTVKTDAKGVMGSPMKNEEPTHTIEEPAPQSLPSLQDFDGREPMSDPVQSAKKGKKGKKNKRQTPVMATWDDEVPDEPPIQKEGKPERSVDSSYLEKHRSSSATHDTQQHQDRPHSQGRQSINDSSDYFSVRPPRNSDIDIEEAPLIRSVSQEPTPIDHDETPSNDREADSSYETSLATEAEQSAGNTKAKPGDRQMHASSVGKERAFAPADEPRKLLPTEDAIKIPVDLIKSDPPIALAASDKAESEGKSTSRQQSKKSKKKSKKNQKAFTWDESESAPSAVSLDQVQEPGPHDIQILEARLDDAPRLFSQHEESGVAYPAIERNRIGATNNHIINEKDDPFKSHDGEEAVPKDLKLIESNEVYPEEDAINEYLQGPPVDNTPTENEIMDSYDVTQASPARTRMAGSAENALPLQSEVDSEAISTRDETSLAELKNSRRSRRASRPRYDSDDSADSGFDIQKRRRKEATVQDNRQPSPVDSTTKDRSSVLFNSSPSARNAMVERAASPLSNPPVETLKESHLIDQDIASPRDASWSFSKLGQEGPTERRSIFGGPVHNDITSSALESPLSLGQKSQEPSPAVLDQKSQRSPALSATKAWRTLSDEDSPTLGVKNQKITAHDSERRAVPALLAGQLTAAALQETERHERQTRGLDQNIRGAERQASRQSNASAAPSLESIHAIIRTPEHIRSSSGHSLRSTGTPPLRRVDASVSSDLRGAAVFGRSTGANSDTSASRKITEVAGPEPVHASSSTYDPLTDKGKGRVLSDDGMADYVSDSYDCTFDPRC